MQRRHLEDPLAGQLERPDLEDHGEGLEDEHTAHNRQQQFLLDENRNGSERAAERERPDIAHEDLRGIGVVPKEPEARADERSAENRQLGGLGKVHEQQVLGEDAMACDVGKRRERRSRDRKSADGQAVEAVGQLRRSMRNETPTAKNT